MKKEYINLVEGEDGNMRCAKCNNHSFDFDASFNFDDHHLTQYRCDKCKQVCGVVTPKEDEE